MTVALMPPGPTDTLSLDAVRDEPLDFILQQTARYGDVVRYQVGEWPCTIINHPDLVRCVLQERHALYGKRGTPDLMMLKPMLGEGLLTTEGPVWLMQRRLTQPAFHRQRIANFAQLFTDMTEKMLDDWATQTEPLRIDAEMSELTLRIVAKALFGYDIEDSADRFSQAVETLNECMGHVDPNNLEVFRRFPAALKVVQGIVKEIIWVRRLTNSKADDLLTMLTEMSDPDTGESLSPRQLLDQIVTLLLAGHETTAKALGWTFYLLDQNPAVADRLHAELDSVLDGRIPTMQDLPNLPYTEMVLNESMRLRSPIWTISRVAVQDDELGGYHIPANSLVIISPYALHRHPDFWHAPEQFDPEHFSAENSAQRPPYAFIPFSGGPRLCIGKPFAEMEMKLVLATIAQRYRLRLLPGHTVEPEALVTLRPRNGLPMLLEARS